ncbi:MAG: hypothetical protein OHK0013_25230 [Sandaracinaceae bacterium]
MTPPELPTRVRVGVTVLGVNRISAPNEAVAFTQVIAQHLPRISYVTFLDGVMYLAFASTVAQLVQIVDTHRADAAGRKELAVRLDVVSRVAFPLVFLATVALLYAFYARRSPE